MIEVRVRGLRPAFGRMAKAARVSARVLPEAVTKEMAAEFERVLVRGSKRRGRPRQARFVPNRRTGGGTVHAGWFGRDYTGMEAYLAKAHEAAARAGFRHGANRARRRFAAIRL